MKNYLIGYYNLKDKNKIVHYIKSTIENDIVNFENYRFLCFKRLKDESDRVLIERALQHIINRIYKQSYKICILRVVQI